MIGLIGSPCSDAAGDRLAGEQLCGKGPGDPGGAEHEPVACSGSRHGHSFKGSMTRSMARRSRVAIIPLLLIRSHTVPSFGPPNARQKLTTGSKSEQGHQDGQGLERLPCEERISDRGLFSLERRQLQGCNSSPQYLTK